MNIEYGRFPNGAVVMYAYTMIGMVPVRVFPTKEAFEHFCRQTIAFRDEDSVPNAFKEAFDEFL